MCSVTLWSSLQENVGNILTSWETVSRHSRHITEAFGREGPLQLPCLLEPSRRTPVQYPNELSLLAVWQWRSAVTTFVVHSGARTPCLIGRVYLSLLRRRHHPHQSLPPTNANKSCSSGFLRPQQTTISAICRLLQPPSGTTPRHVDPRPRKWHMDVWHCGSYPLAAIARHHLHVCAIN